MTPQSSFMVVARLARDRIAEMRDLLSGMTGAPGVAIPSNPLVPFSAFENLHFARFVILDDQTTGDLSLYSIDRPKPPAYLAFLGDFDGDYNQFIDELSARAGVGLRRIFALCEDFNAPADLASWMRAHERKPSTYYCNWVGRTARQCREEEQLRIALRDYLAASPDVAEASPLKLHTELRRWMQAEQASGRLRLTPPKQTPFSWGLQQAIYVMEGAILVIGGTVTLPLTLIPLLIAVFILRKREKTDPEYAPRPASAWADQLGTLEDTSVTNQFSAMGSLKPGLFRSVTLHIVLWAVNLTARLIYTKGRLSRVHTIHFARWVYLDGGTRLFFASNYDGSLDSYMDDFINKVAFGLNAVFSNGIGYPRTNWLVAQGAKNEQLFKYFIRRHELPTEVWYNAHQGLTAFDLERNSRLRAGLEATDLAPRELAKWAELL